MSGSFQVPMGVTWKGEQYTQKGTRGCGLAQPFEEDGDLGDREEAETKSSGGQCPRQEERVPTAFVWEEKGGQCD